MTKTAPYSVTRQTGDIEIRSYPVQLLATVSGSSDDVMFMVLLRYISGYNRPRTEIAMTAPVITGTTIQMTAPVISGPGTMSFVMPEEYTRPTLPEPLDPAVTIREVPARTLAVIRFFGSADEQNVRKMTELLDSTLKKEGMTIIGIPFLMRYNSPWTPGFLRRNEIGVEIRPG
jgi:hypothetical protein